VHTNRSPTCQRAPSSSLQSDSAEQTCSSADGRHVFVKGKRAVRLGFESPSKQPLVVVKLSAANSGEPRHLQHGCGEAWRINVSFRIASNLLRDCFETASHSIQGSNNHASGYRKRR